MNVQYAILMEKSVRRTLIMESLGYFKATGSKDDGNARGIEVLILLAAHYHSKGCEGLESAMDIVELPDRYKQAVRETMVRIIGDPVMLHVCNDAGCPCSCHSNT